MPTRTRERGPDRIPGARRRQFGPENNFWHGDAISYRGAHGRVHRARGKASDHQCAHCTEQAADWAYDHQDEDEQFHPDGRAYSCDVDHYIALCRMCHRRFDGR